MEPFLLGWSVGAIIFAIGLGIVWIYKQAKAVYTNKSNDDSGVGCG